MRRQSIFVFLVPVLFSLILSVPNTAFADLFSWGADNRGFVRGTPTGEDFTAIAVGGSHGFALKTDGSIVGWGYDFYGQASLPTGNNYKAIAAGGYHSLALRSAMRLRRRHEMN